MTHIWLDGLLPPARIWNVSMGETLQQNDTKWTCINVIGGLYYAHPETKNIYIIYI